MQRLGGSVIHMDESSSSAKKGETLEGINKSKMLTYFKGIRHLNDFIEKV